PTVAPRSRLRDELTRPLGRDAGGLRDRPKSDAGFARPAGRELRLGLRALEREPLVEHLRGGLRDGLEHGLMPARLLELGLRGLDLRRCLLDARHDVTLPCTSSASRTRLS